MLLKDNCVTIENTIKTKVLIFSDFIDSLYSQYGD